MWLIPILLRVRSIAGGVASWAVRYPEWAACALLAAGLAYEHHQEVRWHSAATKQAQAFHDAQAASAAMLAAQVAQSKTNAQEAQAHEISDLAANTARGAAYEQSHSVRIVYRDGASIVPPAGDPGVPAGTATDAVVVAPADFDTCTANATYAMNAYEWAQTLESVK